MKKFKVMTMIFLFVGFAVVRGLWVQDLKFPQVSPAATVTQTVGLTEIAISYHRPGVKGRTIWGDLVPYDKVWRAGANEATTIEFSHDVTVEGQALKAGKYGFFAVPGKSEWTVVFSKQADIWGTYGYKEDQDVLRVKVKAVAAPHCEWLNFKFAKLSEDSAVVVLHWEKLMVPFAVKVDTSGIVSGNIEKTMGRYWVSPYYAADFAFKHDMLDKAKEYIGVSTSINKMYWNTLLKAKIYKKMAKTKKETKQAVNILKEALLLGEKLPERQQGYVKEGKKLLEEWTAKK